MKASVKSTTVDILTFLKDLGKVSLSAFFPSNVSYAQSGRVLFGLDHPTRQERYLAAQRRRERGERHRISSMLSHLRKQGFVERQGPNKKSIWWITYKGKQFLKTQSEKANIPALPPPDGVVRLFAFDVPENLRKRRDWLRVQLVSQDFKMLQKSVWVGTRPLTEDFLEELKSRKLFPYIHIASIDRKGTLTDEKSRVQ
jgi:hypothetical protein